MSTIRSATNAQLAILAPRVLTICLSVYLIEIVIGGPGQWQFGSLPSVRHLLFGVLVAAYAVDLAVRPPSTADLFTLGWVGLLFAGWALLLPMLNNTSLSDAVMDARPLFALITAPIIFRLLQNETLSVNYLLRLLFVLSAIVVVLHVLFSLNLYLNGHRVGQDFAEAFFCLHPQCPGVYVGGMPGGGLRVHWIGSIFLLFFIAELFSRRATFWTPLMALALYFAWSRSLWIASIVILVGMRTIMGRRFPWHFVAIIALTFLLVDAATTFRVSGEQSLIVERTGQESLEPGMDVRIEQVISHLKLFAANPFVGTGFGTASEIVRSTTAPWSSESTYTSLAYKLGLIGMFVAAAPFFVLGRRLRAQQIPLSGTQKQALVVVLGFLLMSSTNPYLMNSVGLTFLALLYTIIWWGGERTA